MATQYTWNVLPMLAFLLTVTLSTGGCAVPIRPDEPLMSVANAQRSQQLLTKEDCVQLEEASYDIPGNFESGGIYNSKEYRQCSDVAFSMEPNAGLEILNAFQPEGSCNDLFSDIQRLEKRLFYATVNDIKSMPQ